MDFRNIQLMAKRCHERSGKSTLFLILDILYCGVKYQASPTDYFQAEFYNLNASQRADIITSGVNNEYVIKYCDPIYENCFENKALFYETFSEFLHRDWLVIESEEQKPAYLDFIKDKSHIIVKPALETGGGRGVRSLPAIEDSFDDIVSELPCIIEEVIVQTEELSRLNSSSVNTIRPFTFVKGDKSIILVCYLRIGNGGVVDNFCSGGMVAPIDLASGKIMYPAADENDYTYSTHPISGEEIPGFQIPHWEEVKDMTLSLTKIIPTIQYVGWDIAVTENGPLLIEGNRYPAHAFLNFACHHPDGIYLRRKFEAIMGQ